MQSGKLESTSFSASWCTRSPLFANSNEGSQSVFLQSPFLPLENSVFVPGREKQKPNVLHAAPATPGMTAFNVGTSSGDPTRFRPLDSLVHT